MVLAMKNLLHVGCGGHHIINTHGFNQDEWNEIRLDINPAMKPDYIASITDMRDVPDASIDCVYSSHNLEHLYPHEVPKALAEFRRVLRDDGFCVVIVPDIQSVARMVAEGNLLKTAYKSSAGPITPLDIMYGHRESIEKGNIYMAHHTAFTHETLHTALWKAFFANIHTDYERFTLVSIGSPTKLSPFAYDVMESILCRS